MNQIALTIYLKEHISSRNMYDFGVQFLYQVAKKCHNNPVGRDGVWQAAPVQGSIEYSEEDIQSLEEFERSIYDSIPELGKHGRKRAKKAYKSKADTITKPSYINRVTEEVEGEDLSQIEYIEQKFVQQPYSGGLVFSIFSPNDLFDGYRPGYIPCLVSGSFLFHEGEVHLNTFFRSMSILEFGVHDLLFLRRFQRSVVDEVSSRPMKDFPKRHNFSSIKPGPLNIHLSRAVIERRLARGGGAHLSRDRVYDVWTDTALSHIDSFYTL